MDAAYLVQLTTGLTGAISVLSQPGQVDRLSGDLHSKLLVSALFRLSEIAQKLATMLQTAIDARSAA